MRLDRSSAEFTSQSSKQYNADHWDWSQQNGSIDVLSGDVLAGWHWPSFLGGRPR